MSPAGLQASFVPGSTSESLFLEILPSSDLQNISVSEVLRGSSKCNLEFCAMSGMNEDSSLANSSSGF